jgi:hypothetical protein
LQSLYENKIFYISKMQTGLKSDDFCGYNIESAPFYWLFQKGQYQDTYTIGEVGVPSGGGMPGSYERPEIVDIGSFLSGRDNILSKCMPPTPSLDSLNKPTGPYGAPGTDGSAGTQDFIKEQKSTSVLLPKYTKEKRSANSVDSIDYNRWTPLSTEPQDLRFVIENFSNQRGGFDTRNYVKSAWSNQNNTPYYSKDACETNLDPSRVCGPECAGITGYSKNIVPILPGKPQEDYPFVDITSQQIVGVGAAPCGSQFFSGPSYQYGSCPPQVPQVFKGRQ